MAILTKLWATSLACHLLNTINFLKGRNRLIYNKEIKKGRKKQKAASYDHYIYTFITISHRSQTEISFIKSIAWFWYSSLMASCTLCIATQTWIWPHWRGHFISLFCFLSFRFSKFKEWFYVYKYDLIN